MTVSLMFARAFFTILSVFFMVAYMATFSGGSLSIRILLGLLIGGILSALLIGIESIFKRFNLRSFNTAIIGLVFGYLMGSALIVVFNSLVQLCALTLTLNPAAIEITRIALMLSGTYFGTLLTIRFSEEIHISIPFVRFTHSVHKKKDILIDQSALTDMRLVDLCSSGLLNSQLILPRFIIKDLQRQLDNHEEGNKARVRKSLEVIKKLETMKQLGLRYHETDFSELREPNQKMLRLSRILDANILTGETSKIQLGPASEDTLVINIHSLASALKPLTPPGETITIKVQRYGKEPKQGVGYLEDGTMVVINNGGDYIGEVIETQVISVKQTSAGRIIFTNAMVEEEGFNHSHNYEHQPVYEHQHD